MLILTEEQEVVGGGGEGRKTGNETDKAVSLLQFSEREGHTTFQ